MRKALDVSTLLGLPLALLLVALGNYLEGGRFDSVLQANAALIVFGGTIGAVLVAFPLRDIVGALRALRHVVTDTDENQEGLIVEIVQCAQVARSRGLLALEDSIDRTADPFLARALQLAVDATEPKVMRDILETQIDAEAEQARRHAQVFEAAGGYAPTIGILGAVLGLIHVMENLADPSRLGSGIATAFVATVYGVASANLLLLPIASKLTTKHRRAELVRSMIVDGVLAVQLGENPHVLAERLRSHLPDAAGSRDLRPSARRAAWLAKEANEA